eukprot:TRINITY_DN14052_c0_g1_i2.p1 TRINITY_DN14052_c0_g1~~TRINITY_DN14052_c0_g1_i2.p1  ORF type:complete len:163 (+),score=31.66 TRINITY_DN14052_c0_g1_i2:43-531(+)
MRRVRTVPLSSLYISPFSRRTSLVSPWIKFNTIQTTQVIPSTDFTLPTSCSYHRIKEYYPANKKLRLYGFSAAARQRVIFRKQKGYKAPPLYNKLQRQHKDRLESHRQRRLARAIEYSEAVKARMAWVKDELAGNTTATTEGQVSSQQKAEQPTSQNEEKSQ